MKRKWWVLAQPPYSPQGNRRHSPRVEPFKQGNRPPDVEGNGIVKGRENKWDHGRIPDTLMQNKKNTSVGPLITQQLNPDSPHPIYKYKIQKNTYTSPMYRFPLSNMKSKPPRFICLTHYGLSLHLWWIQHPLLYLASITKPGCAYNTHSKTLLSHSLF